MARRMSRFIQFAMAAGKEAVRDSGIDFAAMDQDQRDRVGVVVNTGGGGIEQIIDGTHVHDREGSALRQPVRDPGAVGLDGRRMLSMEYGLTGPVITQVAACATSVIAFHDALRLIRIGRMRRRPDRWLGGADLADGRGRAVEHDRALEAQRLTRRRRRGRSTATRDGFVLGEGGGVVVVESLAHAQERGATPIAEIIGGALTADAFHISAPDPTGRGQTRAMTSAPCATPASPPTRSTTSWPTARPPSSTTATETTAIKGAYGEHAYKVAISSPKSMIGHLVGAAGIASALAAIGAIRDDDHPADRQPAHSPTRSATSTMCRSSRARRRSRRWPSTGSASVARTR